MTLKPEINIAFKCIECNDAYLTMREFQCHPDGPVCRLRSRSARTDGVLSDN